MFHMQSHGPILRASPVIPILLLALHGSVSISQELPLESDNFGHVRDAAPLHRPVSVQDINRELHRLRLIHMSQEDWEPPARFLPGPVQVKIPLKRSVAEGQRLKRHAKGRENVNIWLRARRSDPQDKENNPGNTKGQLEPVVQRMVQWSRSGRSPPQELINSNWLRSKKDSTQPRLERRYPNFGSDFFLKSKKATNDYTPDFFLKSKKATNDYTPDFFLKSKRTPKDYTPDFFLKSKKATNDYTPDFFLKSKKTTNDYTPDFFLKSKKAKDYTPDFFLKSKKATNDYSTPDFYLKSKKADDYFTPDFYLKAKQSMNDVYTPEFYLKAKRTLDFFLKSKRSDNATPHSDYTPDFFLKSKRAHTFGPDFFLKSIGSSIEGGHEYPTDFFLKAKKALLNEGLYSTSALKAVEQALPESDVAYIRPLNRHQPSPDISPFMTQDFYFKAKRSRKRPSEPEEVPKAFLADFYLKS